MKRGKKNIEVFLEKHLPSAATDSVEEIDARGRRVLRRLREGNGLGENESGTVAAMTTRVRPWRSFVMASMAAVLALAVLVALRPPASRAAESIDGILRLKLDGRAEPVAVGKRFDWGSVVQTTATGATFQINDGSQVEMRSDSELSLERAG